MEDTCHRVVACVITREDRYLVCQRPASKRHGGLWEFPGGKTAPGETDAEAASRELKEELNLELRVVRPALFERQDPGSPFLIAFVPVEAAGAPEPLEHDAIAWHTLDELTGVALAPSDKAFAEFLLHHRQRTRHG